MRVGGWWLAAFTILLAVVAGCSDDEEPSPTPTATTEASPAATATATPSVSPTPGAGGDISTSTVIPTWIEGLTTATDSGLGDAPYFVTYPVISGAPALNAALEAEVQARLDAYLAAHPEVATDTGAPTPELNVKSEFIVASGDVVGVRLIAFQSDGVEATRASSTIWYDTLTGQAFQANALVEGDAALLELAEMTREALIRERPDLAPVLLEEGLAAVAQNYDSIEFDEDGRLVIRFDTDQIVDEEGEPLSIVIALEAVDEELLSELGRRIREEIESPSGSLDLPSEPNAGPTTAAPPAPPSTAEVDCDAVPCIALTYDDGPAQHTARLLDILAERDARVTFYTVGSNAAYQPDLIARIAAAGHEIGNHTYDHLDLTTLSTDGVHEQVDSTQAAIAAGTDAASITVRPPYGATNEVVSGAVGMPQIIWTIDTEDWQDRDAAIVTSRVLEGAAPGVIVLMHDIHSTTVDAAPAIVDGLIEQGYTLVTVSELLADSDPVAGGTYSQR